MNAMKKNVAFCFYGQPRSLRKGYTAINKYIMDACSNYNVHVYVHTWWDKSLVGQHYSTSPWRHIPPDETLITEDVIQTIINLYNPIQIEYESPKDFKDEIEEIKELDIFKNSPESPESIKNNIRNTLSNLYSKYKTSLLLKNSNIDYDCIISLRFDYTLPISVDLSNLISNKVYNCGPLYLSDHFIVFTNNELFIQYSSTFCNIKQINDSSRCKDVASNRCIEFKCNVEELITVNYGVYYSTDEISSIIIHHNCLPNAFY